MSILMNIAAILVALGILVTVHEYGHFWVARRNGIRVLRFSVGFGRPLVRWYDRHGTEFVVAWIPLGGYVKMLDEREAPVPEAERSFAFNSKTPGQRIAVASAGPIANFLFAILAFAVLYSIGVRGLIPLVDTPLPDTPAAVAGFERGDLIRQVDGRAVQNWRDLALALAGRVGDTGVIQFEVERQGSLQRLDVEIERWLSRDSQPNPLANIGLSPRRPDIPAVIGEVMAGGAAERAGLIAGDRILSADGQRIENWLDWVTVIQLNGDRPLTVTLERDGARQSLNLIPELRQQGDQTQGFIGAAAAPFSWPDEQITVQRVMPWTGVWLGIQDTWEMIALSFGMLGKMFSGLVSFEQIGGPISMAQMAGESVQGGLETFIRFLAFISISLGVVNLLPIPVLDGGHILFYSIEWLRGKPLSERLQIVGSQIGLMLIIGLMVLAFVNDIGRLG
ncbi:MAG: RIP metalloprotease RseP [Saccharospirillum sp.]|nr:RIP metalloprotease RseP [Saccharospirillum sp.]